MGYNTQGVEGMQAKHNSRLGSWYCRTHFELFPARTDLRGIHYPQSEGKIVQTKFGPSCHACIFAMLGWQNGLFLYKNTT